MTATLYLAGPMTGLPDLNFPAFRGASIQLREAGYNVYDPSDHGMDPNKPWADFMRLGLTDLLKTEAVAYLPGWENSSGARLEVAVASLLGMPAQSVAQWLALS